MSWSAVKKTDVMSMQSYKGAIEGTIHVIKDRKMCACTTRLDL